MESNPTRKSSTAFEYFLYAAILAETGLAALIYKTIFQSPDLERMRIYFAIFYFGFLGWAIWQLNLLHRRRRMALIDSPPTTEISSGAAPFLGLTSQQLLTVVIVFVAAMAAFLWIFRRLG